MAFSFSLLAPSTRGRRALFIGLLLVLLVTLLLLYTPSSLPQIQFIFSHQPLRRPAAQSVRTFLYAEDVRYARSVDKRRRAVEVLHPEFALPRNNERYTIWDFFQPSFDCPHTLERVGAVGDGGKWVCGMEVLARQDKCVVYSVGE